MKTLILLSLVSLFTHAQIVFLDINDNKHEKKAAIEAAKKAGKTIVVYPEDSAKFEKEKAFEILKNNPPETLFISGHDGGGSFGGDRGESFSRYDLEELVKENPQLKENVQVLGLLGCNTANHSQILDWKLTFPQVKFVAGYDGTGPGGDKPAGWSYIKDTILKTDEILKQTDEKVIKKTFENFEHIFYLEASLYLQTPACSDQESREFIFRPMRKGEERFKLFDTAECIEKRELYQQKHKDVYAAYFNGMKELPQNPSTGELRDVYTFMRQNDHCFEDFREGSSEYPTGDQLLYLLFYRGVRENFSVYYEEELKEFFKQLEIYKDPQLMEIRKRQVLADLHQRHDEINMLLEDPLSFRSEYVKTLNKRKKELEKFPHEYSSIYRKIFDLVDSGEREQALAIYNGQSADFKDFVVLKSQIEDAQKEREKGKDSYVFQELKMYRDNIQQEIRGLDYHDFESSAKYYKDLPAKTYEEFKGLDRQALMSFMHGIHGLPLKYVKNPEFIEELRRASGNMLERLDGRVIPFNWHDKSIPPEDPLDKDFHKKTLNKILNQKAKTPMEETFDNIW